MSAETDAAIEQDLRLRLSTAYAMLDEARWQVESAEDALDDHLESRVTKRGVTS